MREALIRLLPKSVKDSRLPESYRPISLVQVDIKFLAKILAICLNQVILSPIHPDQIGFMPCKNTAFNNKWLFMNFQASHDHKGMREIVALDAANFLFSGMVNLWQCLKRFGFVSTAVSGPRIGK